jgi:putative ABC transport system permease protein
MAGDLAGDLRYALRSWRRNPGLFAVAVVSLAAGLGLNTTVFSVINTVFLQSIRGVPDPGGVVNVGGRVPFTTFREVRDNSQTLARVAAWQPVGVEIRYRDITMRRVAHAASENYFQVLDVRPARGRFFDPAASRQPSALAEVVLDHELWTHVLASNAEVLGDTIVINGIPATILGIAPAAFHGFGPERPALWISMGMTPAVRSQKPAWEDATESGWRVFGRFREGTGVGQVQAELELLAARAPASFPEGPLRASTGRERWTGPVSAEKRIEFLLVVVLPLVVAGLILWIGCSNVANLLLARAAVRRKEIAIRLAAGASRMRLIRLLLAESLLLAFAGGALGLLLAAWTMDLVWATLPEAPRLAVEMDATVLLYAAGICVVATLLFGLVPALQATRVDVAPMLKGGESQTVHRARGTRVRTFFLVTQFASSVALLVVAGTFVKTLVATHVGEQSALIDHLTVAYLESNEASGPARAAHWRKVREELGRIPDVTSVTLMPPAPANRVRLVPEGADPLNVQATVAVQRVDGGFIRTSGMRLLAGRDDPGKPAGGGVEQALVNERAARQFWGNDDPVGKRVSLGDFTNVRISGVVRDDGTDSRVYRPLRDEALTKASVLIRTSRRAVTTLDSLRAVVVGLSHDPALTRVSPLREASTGQLQRMTWVALAIAAVVLSLAGVGLYGSMSFMTAQRIREVAIRMAVGSSRPAMLWLLARDGILIVAAGSALGLALTGVAFRFMSGMIFARWTLDPITILGVLLALSVATLSACYLPGRRAVRLDTMTVLRTE